MAWRVLRSFLFVDGDDTEVFTISDDSSDVPRAAFVSRVFFTESKKVMTISSETPRSVSFSVE